MIQNTFSDGHTHAVISLTNSINDARCMKCNATLEEIHNA